MADGSASPAIWMRRQSISCPTIPSLSPARCWRWTVAGAYQKDYSDREQRGARWPACYENRFASAFLELRPTTVSVDSQRHAVASRLVAQGPRTLVGQGGP